MDNQYEDHWLVQKAKLVAKGAVVANDQDAIRELTDFLDSFSLRQREKIQAILASKDN